MDWYDYGARFYEPGIGRFTTMDPMAIFTPGISPYSYADSDPVGNVDDFGLGLIDVWRKIKDFAMTKILGYTKYGSWSTDRGKNTANVYYRYLGRNHYKPKLIPATPSSTPQAANSPALREKMDFPFVEPLEASVEAGSPNPEFSLLASSTSYMLPEPSIPIPTRPGERRPFVQDIYFVSSSDRFDKSGNNDQQLDALVKTLEDFQRLALYIYGNLDIDGDIVGNSQAALSQLVRYNGQWRPAGDLMSGRAKAIYNYLVRRGIDPRRLDYRKGNVYNSGNGRFKKTSFELVNP